MSSKIGFTRFGRFTLLLAFLAATGCGSGGGGGGNGGGSTTPTPDTTAPRFTGLNGATTDSSGNVVLTSPAATDDKATAAALTYLIYVGTSPDTIDKNATPSHTFTGASACATGPCTFTLTDLNKDGKITYYFASNAKDAAGNLDQDAHPTEASLKVTPTTITPQPGGGNGGGGGGIIPSSSLNVNPAMHAVHPSLAIAGAQRFVIWEECTPAASSTTTGTTTTSTPGWENYHPCSQDTPAQIYVRKGANWDLVSDATLGGRTDISRDPTRHGHNPTLTFDGTNLYTAWKERRTPTSSTASSDLFVFKFDGASWSNTGFPDTDSDDRPALTRHPILGSALGIAYERSAAAAPGNKQLLFRKFDSSWQSNIGPLNKNTTLTAEAPLFSKQGDQLYVTWKEQTVAGSIPNIFVKRWNSTSSNWEDVGPGGALNRDPAKEARFPSIDVLGNVPYVAFHECFDAGCGREHIFVKHFDGSQWIQDKDTGACDTDTTCGSLNSNSRFAETPSLAVHNNQVYVAWSERDFVTNKFAVHIKRLDGSNWVEINPPAGLFVNNAHSPILFSNGDLNIAWVEENAQGILQLIVAKIG
ncbi:MAG: hypothetical protein HY282_01880 [Nitrospirae bacterium]|nr:hypothetical protein [Candidatus Manganitrophaceae bacterium]